MNQLPTNYQEFIYKSRYSRWMPEAGRRENWDETVDRYINFFKKHLKDNHGFDLGSKSKMLKEAIVNLEVMPSMRALMTAGKALERDNVAGYNCAYTAVDSPRAFDESLQILMNGTGVGFSVEEKYTSKLPTIAETFHDSDTTIVVRDSKNGWAKAYKELLSLLYSGNVPKWDVSNVRPKGARLRTFGGRASGPEPLEDLFNFSIETFKKAAGRKLKPIECHDLMCKIAEIVVVGGVRRSAMISLSDLEDQSMAVAKSGAWWDDNPQRALANNSVCYVGPVEMGTFMRNGCHSMNPNQESVEFLTELQLRKRLPVWDEETQSMILDAIHVARLFFGPSNFAISVKSSSDMTIRLNPLSIRWELPLYWEHFRQHLQNFRILVRAGEIILQRRHS